MLSTAPKDGKQAALQCAVRQRQQPACRHHRPQRRGGQRAAGAGGWRPGVNASRSRRRRQAPSPPSSGSPIRRRAQNSGPASRPEPAPGDRRHLHRPDRAGAARTERCRPSSTPGSPPSQRALKLAAMVLAHHLDDRRAGRAVAAGPARRPPDAAVDSRSAGARSPPPTSS